jgi:hypothetical protein
VRDRDAALDLALQPPGTPVEQRERVHVRGDDVRPEVDGRRDRLVQRKPREVIRPTGTSGARSARRAAVVSARGRSESSSDDLRSKSIDVARQLGQQVGDPHDARRVGLVGAQVGDEAAIAQHGVVHRDRHVVAGQAHVDLHPLQARRNRRVEGTERVLALPVDGAPTRAGVAAQHRGVGEERHSR